LEKIIIIGAGGFGREVSDLIKKIYRNKKFHLVGFIDDNKELWKKKFNDLEVLGGLDWIIKNKQKKINYVIAIGNSHIRKKIIKELSKEKINFITIIHPSTEISTSAQIGRGSIIQYGCFIGPDVKLGQFTHLNVNSIIGHDVVIDDFVTIYPNVDINGNCNVGELTNIGAGCITKQNLTIGKNCVIGAGTVLINNVPDKSLVVGVPGKIKKIVC